jgi:uncharacterized RDD family membrane protein YckC
MARWTQTWLSGVGAARPADDGSWPGRGLGLPPEGPGSAATTGARVVAFLVDVVVGALIGALVNAVVANPDPLVRSLGTNGAFAVQYIVLTALTGQTIGMRLVGLRVVHLPAPQRPPGLLPAALRTALIMLVVPVLITDRDRRGLQDKAARTVVVRAR